MLMSTIESDFHVPQFTPLLTWGPQVPAMEQQRHYDCGYQLIYKYL